MTLESQWSIKLDVDWLWNAPRTLLLRDIAEAKRVFGLLNSLLRPADKQIGAFPFPDNSATPERWKSCR